MSAYWLVCWSRGCQEVSQGGWSVTLSGDCRLLLLRRECNKTAYMCMCKGKGGEVVPLAFTGSVRYGVELSVPK